MPRVKHLKMIICDMTGTTIYAGDLVNKSLYETFKSQGLHVDNRMIEDWNGLDGRSAITKTLVNEHNRSSYELVTEIKKYESIFIKKLDKLYFDSKSSVDLIHPELIDFFSYMQSNNIIVALNTSYPGYFQRKLLKHLNIYHKVDSFISSDLVVKRRPEPFMIYQLMRYHGIKDSQTVAKVGDTVSDIKEGNNAKCGVVIGVLSGASDKKTLISAKPDLIVNNIVDIRDYMNNERIIY